MLNIIEADFSKTLVCIFRNIESQIQALIHHITATLNRNQTLLHACLSLLSFIILSQATSCKKETIYDHFKVESIAPKGDEKFLTGKSDFIFDQEVLHTFEIIIPTDQLEKIDDDPVAEKYVAGTLLFNGETVSPVGVRYKGSKGAFVGAVSGNDWRNPSGHKTATKLSLKIKINWEDSSRTFYGLKKLQFHSQNLDESQMHERLGYWLFRQMGVAAPRSVHARLVINGEYCGVYALTEQIDEQFIAHNYQDPSGNLFKEIWPLNYLGQAYDESVFLDYLKTNKKTAEDAAIFKNFADDIVSANDEELRALIKNKMDLNQIIAFAVVDRMIKNDDGPFHWYCNEHGCDNHNYYWYADPSTKKVHLIPWDLDHAFQNIGYGKNPVTRIHNAWGGISNDCEPFPSYARGINQKSAACDKLTAGWASFEQEFDSLKQVFNRGPFSEASVNAQLDAWTAQIREATREASDLHRDALDEDDWDEALENLRGELKHSREDY